MRHWPTVTFDSEYSREDERIIGTAFGRIAVTLYNQLKPFVDEDLIYKDLKVEFVPERNAELLKYGALGLAWKHRNLNYVPSGLGRWMLTGYTGIISMELAHSLIMRLVDFKTGNDLIHYLYNEEKLQLADYVSNYNMRYFGGALKLVIPDLVYGWQHQKEIMDGIKSGVHKEGRHEYWTDVSPATRHDYEHIMSWLKTVITLHQIS